MKEMATPITLEGHYGIEGIEEVLRAVANAPNSPLLLPTRLKNRLFGVDAAVIQLLVTWGRQEGKDLILYARGKDISSELKNLVISDHGLVALLLAERLLSREAHQEVAKPHDEIKRRLHQTASASSVLRGPKLLLLCKDDRHKLEHATPLYYPTADADAGFLMEHEFVPLLRNLLTQALQRVIGVATKHPLVNEEIGVLGKILFELFENTHKWARSDAINEILPWSIRGIRIEVHRDVLKAFQDRAEQSPALRAYLQHELFTTFPTHVRLVEVSVFDSGPGLAARALRRRLTDDDTAAIEYEAVRSRFVEHRSSSAATHRGQGLREVLRLLSTYSGFIRIRTGRLNLQRDFITHPYKPALSRPSGTTPEPYFFDWHSRSTPIAHAPAAGVVMTFLFPLLIEEYRGK